MSKSLNTSLKKQFEKRETSQSMQKAIIDLADYKWDLIDPENSKSSLTFITKGERFHEEILIIGL